MRKLGFVTSWILLVLPLLLSMTLFAERPLLLNMLLVIPGGLLLTIPRKEGPSPLPSKQANPVESSRRKSALPPLPALTTYRAHMMLMTVLAILAVDFPVFPRSLAKCETFGVSLVSKIMNRALVMANKHSRWIWELVLLSSPKAWCQPSHY
jgi:glucosaminylphosphatidylinositol acyltransferase